MRSPSNPRRNLMNTTTHTQSTTLLPRNGW